MKNLHKFILILGAISIILSACRSAAPVEPTPTQLDPNLVYTAAAETAQARLTENALLVPTATPTFTPEPSPTASPTPVVTKVTPEASLTSTSAPITTTADNAVYVSDVTIPDGTVMAPGTSFVKTWKIMNSGSTTWQTTYALVHISDNLLGATSPVPLTVQVSPNQNIDISVEMVAPTANGSYRGFWRMRNAQGQFFGDAIYVDIVVGTAGSSTQAPTVVSPTATTAPSTNGTVSNLNTRIDNSTVTAACPYSYRVDASFNLNAPAAVTYRWEAGSDTPGFTFTLPDAQTINLPSGAHALFFDLQLTNSGSGWVQLHVLSPNDVVSNQATFALTCE
ncbi:MAG: NBR1-Ig-like domain-containing protein [Anaerolineales bacterium]